MPSAVQRRAVLTLAASGLVALGAPWIVRSARAEALVPTPSMTEGPFYPVAIPADADSDLIQVAGQATGAQGVPTLIAGRVLDRNGRTVRGATVEIWQCDANGRYLHPNDRGPRDAAFQGFGRTATDAEGRYGFRTIRPAPYTGRAPHIHFAVLAPGRNRLVTQMFVAGEARNERDFLYRALDAEARRAVTVALAPAPGQAGGALAGTFDIVLAA